MADTPPIFDLGGKAMNQPSGPPILPMRLVAGSTVGLADQTFFAVAAMNAQAALIGAGHTDIIATAALAVNHAAALFEQLTNPTGTPAQPTPANNVM